MFKSLRFLIQIIDFIAINLNYIGSRLINQAKSLNLTIHN